VYCSSRNCTASPTLAQKLVDLGFTEVLDFEGGIDEWERAGFPIQRSRAHGRRLIHGPVSPVTSAASRRWWLALPVSVGDDAGATSHEVVDRATLDDLAPGGSPRCSCAVVRVPARA
jgi:hypothetical protein